jgi:hypothetical protein
MGNSFLIYDKNIFTHKVIYIYITFYTIFQPSFFTPDENFLHFSYLCKKARPTRVKVCVKKVCVAWWKGTAKYIVHRMCEAQCKRHTGLTGGLHVYISRRTQTEQLAPPNIQTQGSERGRRGRRGGGGTESFANNNLDFSLLHPLRTEQR